MNSEPKIKLIDCFISYGDELFRELSSSVVWDDRMKARKTASFGVSYNYSGISYPEVKMHEKLLPICALIEKEVGFFPNNCLINYYLNGDSTMGYHSDSTEDLQEGTGVVIVSLGSERNIAYRHKVNKEIKYKYALKSGSLLYMDKEIQDEWVHAIPKQEGVGERISLTFRLIIKS